MAGTTRGDPSLPGDAGRSPPLRAALMRSMGTSRTPPRRHHLTVQRARINSIGQLRRRFVHTSDVCLSPLFVLCHAAQFSDVLDQAIRVLLHALRYAGSQDFNPDELVAQAQAWLDILHPATPAGHAEVPPGAAIPAGVSRVACGIAAEIEAREAWLAWHLDQVVGVWQRKGLISEAAERRLPALLDWTRVWAPLWLPIPPAGED